ncbi:uncharacterized protein DMAD_12168 [Drosophila madeirensis]|uniref:Secreted protein n=1 Tax=Drosophila madeirensis TaxID=30013 RepID=A0AAU9FFT3_DROMD
MNAFIVFAQRLLSTLGTLHRHPKGENRITPNADIAELICTLTRSQRPGLWHDGMARHALVCATGRNCNVSQVQVQLPGAADGNDDVNESTKHHWSFHVTLSPHYSPLCGRHPSQSMQIPKKAE